MIVIIVRQRADRDQSVGADLVQGYEETEPRDAADPALEPRTDSVRQERGDVAVFSFAFGGLGAAFGHRRFLAEIGKPVGLAVR